MRNVSVQQLSLLLSSSVCVCVCVCCIILDQGTLRCIVSGAFTIVDQIAANLMMSTHELCDSAGSFDIE